VFRTVARKNWWILEEEHQGQYRAEARWECSNCEHLFAAADEAGKVCPECRSWTVPPDHWVCRQGHHTSWESLACSAEGCDEQYPENQKRPTVVWTMIGQRRQLEEAALVDPPGEHLADDGHVSRQLGDVGLARSLEEDAHE
jgi:rubredoxin